MAAARVEMVVYSELFESVRGWLKEDQLLVVEAKVSNRMGDDEYGVHCAFPPTSCTLWTAPAHVYAKRMELHCNGMANADSD